MRKQTQPIFQATKHKNMRKIHFTRHYMHACKNIPDENSYTIQASDTWNPQRSYNRNLLSYAYNNTWNWDF